MKFLNALACVLLFCATIFAQTKEEKKTTPAKEPAPAKTEVKKSLKAEDKGVSKIMGGTIVAIDNAKNIITVRLKSGDYPVTIGQKTDITGKGNKISMADLNKGDYVTINYLRFKNGERIAERVNNKSFVVKSAKAPKKAKTQTKTKQEVQEKAVVGTQEKPTEKKVEAASKPKAKPEQPKESKPAEKKESPPLQK